MRTENEDCWSYPEATEEVWGSVGNVIQEGKSQQRRFQGIGRGWGKRISWGSRFLTAGRPARNGLHFR